MSFTTDPATRQAFITGLRDLADYLDQQPRRPGPPVRHRNPTCPPPAPTTAAAPRSTSSPASSASPPHDDIADSGHYEAVRSFGPVGYRMTAISDARHGPPPRRGLPTTAASPPTRPGPDA